MFYYQVIFNNLFLKLLVSLDPEIQILRFRLNLMDISSHSYNEPNNVKEFTLTKSINFVLSGLTLRGWSVEPVNIPSRITFFV